MLSSQQYELLRSFDEKNLLHVSNIPIHCLSVVDYLYREKYISCYEFEPHRNYNEITIYQLEGKGKQAIAEYEYYIENLNLTRKSVQSAETANKKARNSNIISSIAIAMSFLSIIVSILISCSN